MIDFAIDRGLIPLLVILCGIAVWSLLGSRYRQMGMLIIVLFSLLTGNIIEMGMSGRIRRTAPVEIFILLIAAQWALLHKRTIRSRIYIPWCAFLVAAVISALNAQDKLKCLAGINYYVEHFLVFILTLNIVRTEKPAIYFLKLLPFWGVLLTGDIFRTILMDPRGVTQAIWTKSTDAAVGRSNFVASLLILILPCAIAAVRRSKNHNARVWYIVSAVIIILGILITQSRGALTGLILSLLVPLFLARANMKKAVLWVSVLAIVGGIIALTPAFTAAGSAFEYRMLYAPYRERNVDTRLLLIKNAWVLFKQHPVFGVGVLNGHAVIDFGEASEDYFLAHDYMMDALSSMGILGGAALLWLLYRMLSILVRGLRLKDVSPEIREWNVALLQGTVAVLLHGLVENNLTTRDFGILFWFMMALGCVLVERRGTVHSFAPARQPAYLPVAHPVFTDGNS